VGCPRRGPVGGGAASVPTSCELAHPRAGSRELIPSARDPFDRPQTKSELLRLLFQALALPSSKLRSQSAHSLSVALLTSTTSALVLPPLLQILASPESSTELVHGAMRVFQEGVRKGDLDLGGGVEGDERVLGVVRGLGPVLLGVLGNEVGPRSSLPLM
jgi:hypothetical protein